ncbi:MAG: hypothetical protein C4B57_11780 [Deltaproteobacteria bacterium]|nr:MAG: hypothetical protein C4B57_11780 [Deltaproteobacteria bacterium]
MNPFSILCKVVSVQKWPFFAISVSIGGVGCATYFPYVSTQLLDFLDLAKNRSFLNWKLTGVYFVLVDEHKGTQDAGTAVRQYLKTASVRQKIKLQCFLS